MSEFLSNLVVLKLFVNPNNEELVELYKKHVSKHNASLINNKFPNSGFDIFIPSDVIFENEKDSNKPINLLKKPLNSHKNESINSKMIDMEIKAEMILGKSYKKKDTNETLPLDYEISSPYYLYPRSSISKTPLILANHVGIIDSGYRGFIAGAFRNIDTDNSYKVEKHTRLLQICHPSLCPIFVVMVSEDELSTTERGEGGFGSTGIVGV